MDAILGPPAGPDSGKPPPAPTFDDLRSMEKVRLVVAEALRLYPAPPVLIRRALVADTLPQGQAATAVKLLPGSDVMISVWNLHRSPALWEVRSLLPPARVASL